MNEIHGLILNHEYELVIHGKDCKDYVSPKLSLQDRMQYDSAYIDRFCSDVNLDSVEEKKNLLMVLSDNLWGSESILNTVVYMKCTGLVSKKKSEYFFKETNTSYEEAKDFMRNNEIKLIRETMYLNGDYKIN